MKDLRNIQNRMGWDKDKKLFSLATVLLPSLCLLPSSSLNPKISGESLLPKKRCPLFHVSGLGTCYSFCSKHFSHSFMWSFRLFFCGGRFKVYMHRSSLNLSLEWIFFQSLSVTLLSYLFSSFFLDLYICTYFPIYLNAYCFLLILRTETGCFPQCCISRTLDWAWSSTQ